MQGAEKRDELLNWDRIKQWAESKEAGEPVGVACTNCACPLAEYLGEQTNSLWSVGPAIKKMNGDRVRLEKPQWVADLINAVDINHGEDLFVSREQFLAVLEQVRPAA